jgi:toxin FitB
VKLVLDTNVVSELMRPHAAPAVSAWVKAQPISNLWITSITQAELWFGARLLRPGQKRQSLEAMLTLIFDEDFAGRIFDFDSAAASAYADILSQRRAAGRPMSQFDGQIAAIARVRGAAVVTRNVADFEGCGLVVHNPWLDVAGLQA